MCESKAPLIKQDLGWEQIIADYCLCGSEVGLSVEARHMVVLLKVSKRTEMLNKHSLRCVLAFLRNVFALIDLRLDWSWSRCARLTRLCNYSVSDS